MGIESKFIETRDPLYLAGPITLAHKQILERMLASYQPEISEHTFTNFFVWRGSHEFRLAESGGAIIPYEIIGDAAAMSGPPIGDLSLADACAAIEAASGLSVVLVQRIPEPTLRNAIPAGWTMEEDRDNFDYVYLRSDLAELSGRNLHAKRNLIAQCLAEHECTYEKINTNNLHETQEMMERWCAARGCHNEQGLCHEYQAVHEIFAHYDELSVRGGAIRADGKIEAFSIGERLNSTTAVIHFEKAMPEIKGLYQLINQWFCGNSLSEFEFVNREQDLGLEGLRKTKLSYHPHHLVKKFNLFPFGKEKAKECLAKNEMRCPE